MSDQHTEGTKTYTNRLRINPDYLTVKADLTNLPPDTGDTNAVLDSVIAELESRNNYVAGLYCNLRHEMTAAQQGFDAELARAVRHAREDERSHHAIREAILQNELSWYKNERRLLNWVSQVFGGYRLISEEVQPFGLDIEIEVAGLNIMLSQRQQISCRLTVSSAPSAQVKLNEQTYNVSELTQDIFASLRLLAYAVTTEGAAKLSKDPELKNIFNGTPNTVPPRMGSGGFETRKAGRHDLDPASSAHQPPRINLDDITSPRQNDVDRAKVPFLVADRENKEGEGFDPYSVIKAVPHIAMIIGRFTDATVSTGNPSEEQSSAQPIDKDYVSDPSTPVFSLGDAIHMLGELLPLEPGTNSFVVIKREDLQGFGLDVVDGKVVKPSATTDTGDSRDSAHHSHP